MEIEKFKNSTLSVMCVKPEFAFAMMELLDPDPLNALNTDWVFENNSYAGLYIVLFNFGDLESGF
jgi:hypothetical protein